jgi:hypothetical protein
MAAGYGSAGPSAGSLDAVTVGALEDIAGCHRSVDPALVTRLARACLFGVTPTR